MVQISFHRFFREVDEIVCGVMSVAQRHEGMPCAPCGAGPIGESKAMPILRRAIPTGGMSVGAVQPPGCCSRVIFRDGVVAYMSHQLAQLMAGCKGRAIEAVFCDRTIVHVNTAGVRRQIVGPAIAGDAEINVNAGGAQSM